MGNNVKCEGCCTHEEDSGQFTLGTVGKNATYSRVIDDKSENNPFAQVLTNGEEGPTQDDVSPTGFHPLAEFLSEEQVLREKARLQEMVKQFANKAVDGQQCLLIDPARGSKPPIGAVYSMDQNLSRFRVEPASGSDRNALEVQMHSIHEIVRDPCAPFTKHSCTSYQTTQKFQSAWGVSDFYRRFICVKHGPGEEFALLLPDAHECEQFVTCMKILQTYVGIAESQTVGLTTV